MKVDLTNYKNRIAQKVIKNSKLWTDEISAEDVKRFLVLEQLVFGCLEDIDILNSIITKIFNSESIPPECKIKLQEEIEDSYSFYIYLMQEGKI